MAKPSNHLLSRSISSQPEFSKYLGISILTATKKQVTAELTVKKEFANRNKVMHGGAIMAFADDIGGATAFLNLEDGLSTTTIESKTNFFRPIKIGEKIVAECEILKNGQKIVVLQTTIFRSDQKVAAVVTQSQMKLKFKNL